MSVGRDRSYHNIFVSYRMPTVSDLLQESEYAPAKQLRLENNIKKALINTLEFSRGDTLARFLGMCGITPRTPLEEIRFQLHEDSQSPVEKGRKPYLVEITPSKPELQRQPYKGPPSTDTPIHDARIIGKHFELIIEVKTLGKVSPKQENGYKKKFGIVEKNITRLSWEEVYRSFRDSFPFGWEVDSSMLSAGAFLLRQLLEYLEMQGLSAFAGITERDFDFVRENFENRGKEDIDRIKWLRLALLNDIQENVGRIGNNKLIQATRTLHTGAIKKNVPDPWLSLYEEEKHTPQVAHYGCSIRSDRLSVYVVCEGKSASHKAIEKFKKEADSVARTLPQVGYELRVHRREQVAPREYPWREALEKICLPKTSCEKDIERIAAKWNEWWEHHKYPALILCKDLPRAEVIEYGSKLGLLIVEMFKEMQAFRDFVH